MRALRLPPAIFRLRQFSSWRHDPRSIILRQKSTKASPKIDFLALEAKWQAKWASGSCKPQQGRNRPSIYSSLPPRYGAHLPTPSILDVLSRSGNLDDRKSAYLENGMDLDSCIRTYGKDITLAHAAFHGTTDSRPYSKQGMIEIRQWLESVWEVVLLAHGSYSLTLAALMLVYQAPEELDLDPWVKSFVNAPQFWFHTPLKYPHIFDEWTGDDGCRKVWLAAQEVLFSMLFRRCH